MRQCLRAIGVCLLAGAATAWAQGAARPLPAHGEVASGHSLRPEVQAILQPEIARFRRIDARDGLSQDSVLALAEDHQGLIWLGTQDGLSRFDGLELTTFRPVSGEPASLAGP